MKEIKKHSYNERMIVSGKIIEWYEYEKPVFRFLNGNRLGRSNSIFTSEDIKEQNRKKTAVRARTFVKRTVNANPHLDKFLTLTFKENLTDLTRAWYELDKFIKRLKTRFKKVEFVNVVEFQERGAVHFHLLCNLPYVDVNELAKIWKNGFIKLNRIDNVDNVGAYITKYMTKDSVDARLKGRKCYSMSRGLKKPKEYTRRKDIRAIAKEILNNHKKVLKRSFSKTFESEYYGKVKYMQVVLSEEIALPKKRRVLGFLKPRLYEIPDDTPCPFS